MVMVNSMLRLTPLAALLAASGLFLTCARATADGTVDVTLKDKGMESMAMELSAPEVAAGQVTFNVTNKSETLVHEFVVARSDQPIEALPYNDSEKEVSEDALEVVDEIEDIDPGKSGALTLDLKPGTYLMLCNKTGHYKAGMVHTLKVTE